MKKRVLPLVLVIIILSLLVFVIAEDPDLISNEKARECLKRSIGPDCSGAQTVYAKAFSAMALGSNWTYQSSCRSALMEVKKTHLGFPCWGDGGVCNLKDTSKALIALSYLQASQDTLNNISNWIISQEQQSTDLIWLLEIDQTASENEMQCDITKDGVQDTTAIVSATKEVTVSSGSCFETDQTGYFLKIKKNCYSSNFTIQCSEDFLTTLLYKRENIDVYHISVETHRTSKDTKTRERIDSICFGTSGVCDYEGSLWASMALSAAGFHHSESKRALPYLVTGESENDNFFPPAFLYSITGDSSHYLTKVNNLPYYHVNEGDYRWLASNSNNEFYDTAIGMYVNSMGSTQKNNAKTYLLEEQEGDGCWNTVVRGNIEGDDLGNNAFLIFAGWPLDKVDPPAGASLESCSELTGRNCTIGFVCNDTVVPSRDNPTCCTDTCLEIPPVCTDSDGGINNATIGTVDSVFFESGNEISFTATDNCSVNNQSLNEYYCNASTNRSAVQLITCPHGCFEGVCKDETILPCANLCNKTAEPTMCSGSITLKTCGDYDSDSCDEWSNGTLCDYKCSDGKCVNRSSGGGTGTQADYCSDAGFFCLAPGHCSQTNTFSKEDFFCGYPGDVCCKENVDLDTCADLSGSECESTKTCSESTIAASDTANCCRGTCDEVGTTPQTECVKQGGFCKSSCFSTEKEEIYTCNAGMTCCKSGEDPGGSNVWIIILLIILIILVVLAIIFRNQLKIWLFKMKSKFSKGKGPAPTRRPGFPGRPGFPPRRGMPPRPGLRPRQIIPRGRPISRGPSPRGQMPPRGQARAQSRKAPQDKGFDDTLKKLKEMTK